MHINKQHPKIKINPLMFSQMMAKTTPVQFFFLLYFILAILLYLMPPQIHSSTLESDTQALHEIKKAIDPNSVTLDSYLNSWDFTVDPCESTGSQFLGILCDLPLDNNSSSRVTVIDLDAIGYDGFLTPAIGNLTELTILNLDNNKFRGPIPETIAKLRKITRIAMSQNFFTGAIPERISELKKLEYLDVSGNRLSGQVPSSITGLRGLTFLDLSNNGFAGKIPNFTGLWQLNTLDLSANQFYGVVPNLPLSLRKLNLSHNILSGHITSLKGLMKLKWLDVSDNRLSGPINKDILDLSLKGVVHINISFNRFTTLNIVNYSGQRTKLQVLEAQRNHLRGHLPLNLVTFSNLTTINLSNNQFSGPIPKEYGAKVVTSWRRLYLDHNFLTGNLPREFSHIIKVRGSVANNCLKCPSNVLLCHGGQRPRTDCVGQHKVLH